MTIWTRESFLTYRSGRSWPKPQAGVCDEAVTILNDAHNVMQRLRGLADVEPAICFSIGPTEKGHE